MLHLRGLPSSVFVFFFLGFVRVLFFIHRFKVEGGVPACLEQNSREACFARLVSEEHCGEIVLSCRNTVMARVFAAAASVTTPAAVTLAVRSGETGSFSVICKGAVLRHGGQALQKRVLGVRASTNEVAMQTVNGVVFEPFSEVQDQLVKVTTSPQFESLARQRFAPSLWNTTFHISTTPCTPISIVTMLGFQDLRSISKMQVTRSVTMLRS